MTPIERMNAKTAALSTLGLDDTASHADLRSAWKRRARETHPDRPDGRLEDFLNARAAFEALTEGSVRTGEPDADQRKEEPRGYRARPPRAGIRPRPRLAERTQALADDLIEEAHAALAEQPDESAIDHVAEAILRSGRHLVFVVSSAATTGRNRIALPTEVLSRLKPGPVRIFPVDFGDAAAPERFDLPEATVDSFFPGARGVSIHFAGGGSR